MLVRLSLLKCNRHMGNAQVTSVCFSSVRHRKHTQVPAAAAKRLRGCPACGCLSSSPKRQKRPCPAYSWWSFGYYRQHSYTRTDLPVGSYPGEKLLANVLIFIGKGKLSSMVNVPAYSPNITAVSHTSLNTFTQAWRPGSVQLSS